MHFHVSGSFRFSVLLITCIILSFAVVKPIRVVHGFTVRYTRIRIPGLATRVFLSTSSSSSTRSRWVQYHSHNNQRNLNNHLKESSILAMNMPQEEPGPSTSVGEGIDDSQEEEEEATDRDSSSSTAPASELVLASVPEASDASEIPETPEASEAPELREVPEAPEAPELREAREVPEAPATLTIPKLHSMTVCMVPHPKDRHVWEAITQARTELKDPGLFRWPPHANLLYPFLNLSYIPPSPPSPPTDTDTDIKYNDDDDDDDQGRSKKRHLESMGSIQEEVLERLGKAVQQCEPFRVVLDSFGTFGGAKRGVLYLYPRSYNHNHHNSAEIHEHNSTTGSGSGSDSGGTSNKEEEIEIETEPLIQLQSKLFEHFPECPDQQKHGGQFTPHMTLSHFPSLQDALDGQELLEKWWKPTLEFDVTEIYLLKRVGDGGQFKILATAPLGMGMDIGGQGQAQGQGHNIQVHDPPMAFPGMPLEEEDWVKEERMKLKARRNGNGRRGNRRRRSGRRKKGDRGPSRSRDSPEVIAQKRAERAAKRERLAREAAVAAIAAAIDGSGDIEL